MDEVGQAIYQSGQKVLVDGLYEAVATQVPTVSQLTMNQMFPNHDGRAVCWHLWSTEPRLSEIDSKQTKVIYEAETSYGGMYS
jgi:hypothetical protein